MSAIYEDQLVIPLQAVAATRLDSADLRAQGAMGLYVTRHVKTVTTGNATIRLMGREPFEATEYQVNVDVTVTATGRHVWIFAPGVAKTPPGEAAPTTASLVRQFVGLPIPDRFFIRVEKSDSSSWEVGVAIRRTPA